MQIVLYNIHMLKSNINWTIHKSFQSGTDNEPIEFFSECLFNSTQFDLMLGFFSSSAIRVLCDGFATFLYNGGKMRLIINNILSERDKNAVEAGLQNDVIDVFDLSDIGKLKDTLSKKDTYFFECLSWLIAHDRIEIKIIAPKKGIGISHTKSGVFSDGNNVVAFSGSCNFSKTALIDNIERIDAFCSWDGEAMISKSENIQKTFEKVFSGNDNSVRYLDANEIETSIYDNFKVRSIEELLEIEKELNDREQKENVRPTVKRALRKANKMIEKNIERINIEKSKPKFPYTESREYQKQAFENWRANGKKGIFAMATGTGKTITSLNCLLEEFNSQGVYRVVILVPTIALVEQWEEECRKFNFTEIIKVCSASNWLSELGELEMMNLLGKKTSFVIIATYASFVLKKFQNEFVKLPNDTLLIADEAHNMGSPSIQRKMNSIHLQKRIGLSATPERQYQDEINSKIRVFFNESSDKYTFEYSMYDAIKKEPKALCTYRYYPVLVKLTDKEFNDYIELTKKIARFKPKNKEEKEIFNLWCIQRQRILHKAENKVEAFKKILQKEYNKRGNLKYTLVYAPEGLGDEDTIFDASKSDAMTESASDRNILNHYTQLVSSVNNKVTVRQFTGNTPLAERTKILKDFSEGKLEVITSMKCLDEGVDVPRAELAVFCASTGNPRQFIQRRGRVLRLHPDKFQSTIYDLVVIPEKSKDPELYKIERKEVKAELRRVRDFAEMSDNFYDTLNILKDILNYYQLIL